MMKTVGLALLKGYLYFILSGIIGLSAVAYFSDTVGIESVLLFALWTIFPIIMIVWIVGVCLQISKGVDYSSSENFKFKSSYNPKPDITYALQRSTGVQWQIIAKGPENWMIDKMNQQTDNARYRVVMLVDGKVSGTSYS